MGFLFYLVIVDILLRLFTKRLFISFLIAFLLSLYSYYETLKPEIIFIEFPTKKLPEKINSFRILHISDLHLGPVMGLDKIEWVKRAVSKYKPHLIVSTGDLVDGNMENREYLKLALKEIKVPFGKFAIPGNHEYYRGIEKALFFTEEAGFKVLRGECHEIEKFLLLCGLDDDDCRHFKKCKGPLEEEKLLANLSKDKFILFLKHKPRVSESSIGLFDLMLSGHTHGGLYYPFGKWLLKIFFKLEYPGFHSLGKGSYLFVSKGIGTGGPPMRFLSPPDLAIIELKADTGASPPVLRVLSDPL
ncbi:MAG: metallophosphoesterase [Caldimicrobium sp.]